jgi:pilus assembly protein CpaE
MSLKLSLLATHASDLQRLNANVPTGGAPINVTSTSGDQQTLLAEISRSKPNVVVADFSAMTASQLLGLESIIRSLPNTSFILLAENRTPEFLLNAMRVGVREVIPTPLINGELKEAVTRQIERYSVASGSSTIGSTLAFVSAKGGSGATLIATSLAVALAKRGRNVGFFDLNLQFGDALMYLTDKQATASLSDLVRQIDRADPDFLRALMSPIQDRLLALPGPESAERAMEVKPAAIEQILSTSRNTFDFTVLDIGRGIDAVSVKALDACDFIYVVLQYTVPSIQDSKRLLNLLTGLGYPRDKVRLVANRVQKGGDIGAEEVQKALGIMIHHQIPNSWAAAVYTANHGVPIAEHAPKDPLTKAIADLAISMVPKQIGVPSKRWLGQLFGPRASV